MESLSAEEIRKTRRSGRIVIDETDKRTHLSDFLTVFAERRDLSIEVHFIMDGMEFAAVVPAGYDLTALLDGRVTDTGKLIDEFGAVLTDAK